MIQAQKALFARWTSDWDCETVTEFWYVIKDKFISIDALPSKRRWEIKQGLKNFDIKKVEAGYIVEHCYPVYRKAFASYTTHLAPFSESEFKTSVANSINRDFWVAQLKSTGQVVGYSENVIFDNFCNYSVIKLDPEFTSKYFGYALLYTMDEFYLVKKKMAYVNDGARSVLHDTNIQDFLIRKMGFRRAYCRLNIQYSTVVGWVVRILYPFRFLFKNQKSGIGVKVGAVLLQEKIRRSYL